METKSAERICMKRFGKSGVFPIILLGVAVGLTNSHAQPPKRAPLVSPEVHGDGKVTFRLVAAKAEKVVLSSGEMQPVLMATSTPMEKGADGLWSVTVGPLPPGLYDYTFNVDG